MDKESSSFGKIRSLFWPIHRYEFKKVFSLILLFCLLCISYSLLRNLKDIVVLTAKDSGAEVIPFIKVWGMLPAAIVGTWFYSKLCSMFKREKVFYILISSFLLFFLLFAFVLYPLKEHLHFHGLQNYLLETLPSGFKGLIAMCCNWTFTLFYIIAELWSVLVLTVLFWGVANDINTVSEAKRSYGILNIGSNLAPLMGGFMAIFATNKMTLFFLKDMKDVWGQTIINIVLLVALLGGLALLIFCWMQKNVFTKPLPAPPTKDGKGRMSLRASIRFLLKSKYLVCLAVIVLGFNIAVNLTDILWKQQLTAYFTDKNDMLIHLSYIQVGLSIVATVGAVLFTSLVRRFGWTLVAIITPMIMTVMGIGFFSFLFFGDYLATMTHTLFGLTPMAMTVYFGSMQNCLSKAAKYSVFDASRELAYLPLDSEARLRGKAAIGGLGSGVGKSGASLLYQGLLFMTGGIAFCGPYIAVILFIVFVSWFSSVVSLGRQFNRKTAADAETSESEVTIEEDATIVEG